MSKINNKSTQYKTEIKNLFKSFNAGNNELIVLKQLNNFIKLANLNQKNPFLYDLIKTLISIKNEENEDYISYKEFISFIDEQLNENDDSKEEIKKTFNIFRDGNKDGFSLLKLVSTCKELGDEDTSNKLLKLIEQAKLNHKEINFEEFSEIMNDDYNNDLKSQNESEDYEENENYKVTTKIKKMKEDEEDMKTISSKNEDIKENEAEKTNKRYHRRYRDTKNKNEYYDNINNVNNRIFTKYRKKK